MPAQPPRPPLHGAARGIHALTLLHAVGSVVCLTLAAAAVAPAFRQALAISPGARLMIDLFGAGTSLFLLAVALTLATLAYGSWTRRPWAWHLTLACYAIGVLGSLWEVAIGIQQAWLSAAINALVVAYASLPDVRRAYRGPRRPGRDPRR